MVEKPRSLERPIQPKEILPMNGGFRSEIGPDGFLTIFNPEGLRIISDASARVDISDGRTFSTKEGKRTITITDTGAVRMEATKDGVTLGWNIVSDKDLPGLRMTQDIHSTKGEALAIDRFIVLDVEDGFAKAPADQLATVYYGYQSWDITQRGSKLSYNPDRDRKQPIQRISETSMPMSAFTSLQVEDGSSMFIGFTSTDRMHTVIEVDPTENAHRITAWNDGEGVKGIQASEEMLLLFDMPEKDALTVYKQKLLANRGITDKSPLLEVSDYHCTWYEDRLNVTRESNLAQVERLIEFPTVKAFITDDGWEEGLRPGDWIPNAKFRSAALNTLLQDIPLAEVIGTPEYMGHINTEMKGYTDEIHAHGKKAYLWLAPGGVHSESATAQAHPEWLIKDEQGKPLDMLNNPDWDANKIYALDITNPEVQEHVDETFDQIFYQWGFDGVKIDFLRLLYDKGERHDETVTSMEAGNMFMKRIWDKAREREGDERVIIGCGVPLIPAIGYVDSVRISPDAHPRMVVLEGLRGQTYNNRMNAHRSSTYEGLFELDHDPLLLRRDSELTPHQRNAAIVTSAVFGGINGIGDNLARMQAEDPLQYDHTRRVMERLARSNGVPPARPIQFDHEGNPLLAAMHLSEHGREWVVAASFNHTGKTKETLFTPETLGLDPARAYDVFDTIHGKWVGSIHAEPVRMQTEYGGANLVCIFERDSAVPTYEDFLGRSIIEQREQKAS